MKVTRVPVVVTPPPAVDAIVVELNLQEAVAVANDIMSPEVYSLRGLIREALSQ